MKKSAGLLGLISVLAIGIASASDTCTYKFTAPATSAEEPGHQYVTYFVQDVKTYQTRPLKIGSRATEIIKHAPCKPFVVYATYSKSDHKKVRSDIYQCPSHSVYFVNRARFPNPNHQLIIVNQNIEINHKSYKWKKMQNCQPATTDTKN